MATHSSIPAWKIPWTEEPGRLHVSMGSQSWTRLSNFTFTFSFQESPIPVASHGQPMPPPETPTLAARFGLVLCEVTAPFPCVLVHARFCLCFLRVESVSPSSVKAL